MQGEIEDLGRHSLLLDNTFLTKVLSDNNQSINFEDLCAESLGNINEKTYAEILCNAVKKNLYSLWQFMITLRSDCLINQNSESVWRAAISCEKDYFIEYCDRRLHNKLAEACKIFDLVAYMICGK